MVRRASALGLLFLLIAGCVNPQTRAKMAEEAERERDLDVRTVGDVSIVGNVAPMQVQGVGLVMGLSGTGHSPPGFYRGLLEQYLLKNSGNRGGEIVNEVQTKRVRQVLDDPNNCLVIVKGYIPAGARRGDLFDVEVTLPEGSKASSLAGGSLQICPLRVWEAEANLSERMAASSKMVSGHVYATAKGQLVVAFGNNQDPNELRRGRIWQGASSRIDRAYAFMMRNDDKSLRAANDVAQRINFMYQDEQKQIMLAGLAMNQLNQKHDPNGATQTEMAKAASKDIINVRVPLAYRHDHERFLRVARLTPLHDKDPDLPRYRKRLEKMLQEPRDTVRAALRLEAMGRDSIPSLKAGLDNSHPFVRFACAESLAYLSSPAGVDELAQLATEHSLLTTHGTLALASLGENVCRHKLADMLVSSEPAVRCAAFHAFTLLDETDHRLGGVHLHDSFWLYRQPMVPNNMVYYSTARRAQVVLFGRNITLSPKTRMLVGKDFTVTMNEGDGQCTVKRITTAGEEKRVTTSRLDDVLTALSDVGAAYPDIVDFLRRAGEYQYINCPVSNWTVPSVPLETLIADGQNLR
jgi:flagellar basal body P-ring protein FlgI